MREENIEVEGGGVSSSSSGGRLGRIGERVRNEVLRLAETSSGRRLELRRVFEEFDTDRNGRVDAYELGRGLRKLRIELTGAELDDLMDHQFQARGGEISYADFVEFAAPHGPDSPRASYNGGVGSSRRPVIEEGMRVKAQFRGKGKFYPGRIRRANRDGTYDVDFDDGDKDTGLREENIERTVNTSPIGSPRRGGAW